MKKFNKWFMIFLTASLLIGCGSDDSSSSSSTTTTSNESEDSTSDPSSLPSDVQTFRNRIVDDEMVKIPDGAYFEALRFYHGSCTISYNTYTSSWSQFKDQFKNMFRNQCQNSSSSSSYEYSANDNVQNAVLGTNSRVDHINRLVEIIDNSDESQVQGNFLYTKNGDKYYVFDINVHAAGNPVQITEKLSDTSYRTTQFYRWAYKN